MSRVSIRPKVIPNTLQRCCGPDPLTRRIFSRLLGRSDGTPKRWVRQSILDPLSRAKGEMAKTSIDRLAKRLIQSLAYCSALLLVLPASSILPTQKQDYLTDDEIEQLREAQEPAERMKLLDDFLKERLQKAKALKSPASVSAGENKSTLGKDKGSSSKDAKKERQAGSSAQPQKAPQKSFVVLMGEYLQCLEEISSNVENFSSFKLEPKAYLKSLKALDQSLQEHRKWIAEISGKLNRSEKGIVADVSEALEELSADVNAGIQKANDEVKVLKESRKGKNE